MILAPSSQDGCTLVITVTLAPSAEDSTDPCHRPCRCQPVFPLQSGSCGAGCGFTLIEMLCVLAIISLL
ncbi:MAG: type II secretion system protein, partial [Luminiphilus sp.]